MKKIKSVLLLSCTIIMLSFALTGCGNNDNNETTNGSTGTTTTTQGTTEGTGTDARNRDGMTNNGGGAINDIGNGVGNAIEDIGNGIGNGVKDITDTNDSKKQSTDNSNN